MATAALTRLRWQFAHALSAIGLPGQVALAVLLGSALVEAAIVLPLSEKTARLQISNSVSEQRIATTRAHPQTSPASPAEQMTSFEQRFPGDRDISVSLARIVGVAKKRGVRLEQAEFKFVSEAGEPLQRYSILLPLKADYRSLRGFLHDALLDQPALALEDMNLRRSDAKSTMLDAQVHFVLFVRRPA